MPTLYARMIPFRKLAGTAVQVTLTTDVLIATGLIIDGPLPGTERKTETIVHEVMVIYRCKRQCKDRSH